MSQEPRILTITELNMQQTPNINSLPMGIISKENKAKKRAKQEAKIFYTTLGAILASTNIAFFYCLKSDLTSSKDINDSSNSQKFINSIILSTPILLLFIKGKSCIFNRIIRPSLPNLNASKDIAPTQKKRAILWTMSPKLKIYTLIFEHFYRSTYTAKQWLDIQKHIWQIASGQVNQPFSGLNDIHNEILDPHTPYPRRLICANILSWSLLSLDLLNLGVFELDNYINGFNQLATISPILRNYSTRHRHKALIRYTIGSVIKLLHSAIALARYYPHLLFSNLNHSIVAAFNSNKHPNRLLFFGFLINLLPVIGLAIYAHAGSRQNQPQHQHQVAQTRNTFAFIHGILLLQGPFWVAPLLNPIDPKNKSKILKCLNPNHLYKSLFKQYLESTNLNYQNVIFTSFLYNNKEGECTSMLENEQNQPKNLSSNILKTNLRFFMPLASLNASLGLIRNILASTLLYVFEHNAGSDRSNPALACTRFFAGLILGPIIAACSLLKKITNIPNQIFMNSYNKSSIFPHRLTAFVFAITLTLGAHHTYLSDIEFSLPAFLSILTAMSLQLTAIITTPIHYATPKPASIDLFLNYTNNQTSYDQLFITNTDTNDSPPGNNQAPQEGIQLSEQSTTLDIWTLNAQQQQQHENTSS